MKSPSTDNLLIDLVLADDWEIRGDGSGDPRALQFPTARRLMRLYEDYGIRGTFNVEVMQQRRTRELVETQPDLRPLADQWDELVREMATRGHDVQLHALPQWWDARRKGDRWVLGERWSLTDYPANQVRDMLRWGKNYLETLLRPIRPDYRCRAFRAGAWGLAPSDHVLPVLAELGIVFDMSIARGIHYQLPMIELDYREIDEDFLPFYPRMTDARRVAREPTPIVCVPTHTSRVPSVLWRRWPMILQQRWDRLANPSRLQALHGCPSDTPVPGATPVSDYERWVPKTDNTPTPTWADQLRTAILGIHGPDPWYRLTDLSGRTGREMEYALFQAIDRARKHTSPGTPIPVIFENHTKNCGDLSPIEVLCQQLRRQRDRVRVVTAEHVARGIEARHYPIRCDADA